MADSRSAFATLEEADGSAKALSEMQEGDSPSLKSGSIGFSFKDSVGNVVLPQLASDGSIFVDTGGAGTCKKVRGEVAAGQAVNTFIEVAAITLAVSKLYTKINYQVSTRSGGYFQLVFIDDEGGTPTETILDDVILEAGQYTFKGGQDCFEFSTDAVANTKKLLVRAYNWGSGAGKLSALRASITCKEV